MDPRLWIEGAGVFVLVGVLVQLVRVTGLMREYFALPPDGVVTQGKDSMSLDYRRKRHLFVKPRGMVYVPPSELDEAREAVIAQNAAEGKDTRLSDLQDENEEDK